MPPPLVNTWVTDVAVAETVTAEAAVAAAAEITGTTDTTTIAIGATATHIPPVETTTGIIGIGTTMDGTTVTGETAGALRLPVVAAEGTLQTIAGVAATLAVLLAVAAPHVVTVTMTGPPPQVLPPELNPGGPKAPKGAPPVRLFR